MSVSASPAPAPVRPRNRRLRIPQLVAIGVLLLFLAGAPTLFSDYIISQILVKALWLGIAAASLIFLSSYGGMVSLGQTGLFAVAGFTMANLVHAAGGRNLGWDPLLAVVVGIAVATLFGLLCGAIAARSYGIYFLMITLAISVIVFYFFGQATPLSGYERVVRSRAYSSVPTRVMSARSASASMCRKPTTSQRNSDSVRSALPRTKAWVSRVRADGSSPRFDCA